jgi:uncharacterized protein (DUF924 family)
VVCAHFALTTTRRHLFELNNKETAAALKTVQGLNRFQPLRQPNLPSPQSGHMKNPTPIASAAIVFLLAILVYQYQMSLRAFSLNKSVWNPFLYKRVREAWFSDLPVTATCPRQDEVQRWFTGSAEAKQAFDKLCHTQFYSALESIDASNFPLRGGDFAAPFLSEIQNQGTLEESTETALGLLILLDQIPRNLFRTKDTLPAVYNHYDPIALSLIKSVLKMDPRPDLHASIRASPVYRQWFYMPLMHSEDIADHEIFNQMVEEMDGEVHGKDDEGAKGYMTNMKGHEKSHRSIIERFGRYPHRNAALGRKSTNEEEEYMRNGGESFGVVK